MYSCVVIKNADGVVRWPADYRYGESGYGTVVGAQCYSNRGTKTRSWARFGVDVWSFWPACRNQRVTRADLGLPPLPEQFEYGDHTYTVTKYF